MDTHDKTCQRPHTRECEAEEALSVNPAPANRGRDTQEKEPFNLAVAFRDRKANLVRFAADLRVPFTNTRAESDVRMVNARKDQRALPGH